MKSELLPSWLIVIAFWCAVLGLFSEAPAMALLIVLPFQLLIPGVMLMLGGGVSFLLHRLSAITTGDQIRKGIKYRGVSVNMGELPMLTPPLYADIDASVFAGTLDFGSFRKHHPKHAALLLAIARVMGAYPKLPASPVNGGHGGATLMEHSLRVVKAIYSLAPTWRFKGLRKRNGDIDTRYPIRDPRGYYEFHPMDPILPVVAFAHDIGKTVVYSLDEHGVVSEGTETSLVFSLGARTYVEKKREHDTEGAKLLRRMPELWDLPYQDVRAILLAVNFYHKIGSFPVGANITDRDRALVELLIDADQLAGRFEAALSVFPGADQMPPSSEQTVVVAGEAEASSGHEGAQAVASTSIAAEAAPVPAKESWAGWPDDRIFEAFSSILHEQDRVNGTNAKARVAFKFGEWLYVCDWRLRKAVSDRFGDDSINRVPVKGHAHPWIARLMEIVAEKGALLQVFDDKRFHPKSALFIVYGPGQSEADKEFYFVVNVSLFDRLAGIPDCKSKPNLAKPAWENRAIRTKDAPQSDLPEADLTDSADHDLDAKLHRVLQQSSASPAPGEGGEKKAPAAGGGRGGRSQRASITDVDALLSSLGAIAPQASDQGHMPKVISESETNIPIGNSCTDIQQNVADNCAVRHSEASSNHIDVNSSLRNIDVSNAREQNDGVLRGSEAGGTQMSPFLEFLRQVASGETDGPEFERRELGSRKVALFEAQEARSWFGAEDEDMENVELMRGAVSGKLFIVLEVAN